MSVASLILTFLVPLCQEEPATVLKRLEAKFQALEPFRAVYEMKQFDEAVSLTLHADRKNEKFYFLVQDKKGKSLQGAYYDGHTTFVWDSEKAFRIELRSLWKNLKQLPARQRRELQGLLPDNVISQMWKKEIRPTISMVLEPRESPEKDGGFRVAFGRATTSAYWFTHLRKEKDLRVMRLLEGWEFTSRSGNSKLLLDPNTGLPRRFWVRNHDDSIREIVLAEFGPLKSFPAYPGPKKVGLLDPSPGQIHSLLIPQTLFMIGGITAVVEHWKEIESKKEVCRVITRWAAGITDVWRRYAHQQVAMSYVRYLLKKGTTLRELKNNLKEEIPGFREALRGTKNDIRTFLQEKVEELRNRALTSFEEIPRRENVDEQIRGSLEFDAIEKALRELESPPFEDYFKQAVLDQISQMEK